MEHLAPRLAQIPGVVAVALGGSRATGTQRPDSDWDFGLYYRGTIDPDDVRALGFDGEVFAPGEWGRVVNGGAWLTIDGERVDIIYCDLDQVLEWTDDARQGRFQVFREVGYAAGIPTYSAAACLALNRVLVGTLPKPAFPERLRETAPPWWRRIGAGAMKFAAVHARRGDEIACNGNLAVAALAEAHARLCERGEWYLNEKGLLARAGIDAAARRSGSGLVADVEDFRAHLSERAPPGV